MKEFHWVGNTEKFYPQLSLKVFHTLLAFFAPIFNGVIFEL